MSEKKKKRLLYKEAHGCIMMVPLYIVKLGEEKPAGRRFGVCWGRLGEVRDPNSVESRSKLGGIHGIRGTKKAPPKTLSIRALEIAT